MPIHGERPEKALLLEAINTAQRSMADARIISCTVVGKHGSEKNAEFCATTRSGLKATHATRRSHFIRTMCLITYCIDVFHGK